MAADPVAPERAPVIRTLDAAAVARATIFVDTVAGALVSGDLAQPLAAGLITEASITADLRALATGAHGTIRGVEAGGVPGAGPDRVLGGQPVRGAVVRTLWGCSSEP